MGYFLLAVSILRTLQTVSVTSVVSTFAPSGSATVVLGIHVSKQAL